MNEEKNVMINENVETTQVNAGYQNVIKKLIASGCKRINNIKVKNTNVTVKDTYTQVSFSIDKPVKGFVDNGEGVFEESTTNVVYGSIYAICGTLKENEDLSWIANPLRKSPNIAGLLFNGATITIVQQEIAAGEEYVNPFTTQIDPEPVVFDHDVIINHIVDIKLGKMGEKMADKLADKLMSESVF